MGEKRLVIALTLYAVFCAGVAYAVAPTIGEILPRGAKCGGVAEVDIVGGNLSDAVDLMFHEPGI